MATFNSFEEIEAWRRARKYAQRIFDLSIVGSLSRDFGLRDQINRSTGSIMDNIAEGFERGGKREFIQSLSVSKGSAGESRSQLYRALDRRHLTPEDFEDLNREGIEIGKMVWGLMEYLRTSELRGPKFK
jgi:four helix bundle protein